MNNNKLKGQAAEESSTQFLKNKGYNILFNNYRFGRCEIDIIAKKETILVFVEVKYRTNLKYGFPEHFVSDNKIRLYHEAATKFIEDHKWNGLIRFDIISLSNKNSELEIIHLEDAF